MKTIKVKDLMVPREEYASVSQDATLYEAVLALEEAQEALDRTRYHYLHRAVLVHDENDRIIGKVSQLDALRALEPKYAELEGSQKLSSAGFSPDFLRSLISRHSLWDAPLNSICTKAAQRKVKTFMHKPEPGEFIGEDATLDEAINLLVVGKRQSLLVRGEERIVGILRLTDVFKHIFQLMKACAI